MHYFNTNEGNGQSHTFCGAKMTPEEYAGFLNSDAVPYVGGGICRECDRMATAQDEYAYHHDL